MREVKQGNKVPFHGYLLNISEYEKYTEIQAFLEKYKPLLENQNLP